MNAFSDSICNSSFLCIHLIKHILSKCEDQKIIFVASKEPYAFYSNIFKHLVNYSCNNNNKLCIGN